MSSRLVFGALAAAVLSFSCGSPPTPDAGAGGGGGAATGGGSGGGTGAGTGSTCAPAPAFVPADLSGVAGFDPGGTMTPPFNFATFARPSTSASRIDVMFNEFYGAGPATNVTIPATNYQLCEYCFVIQTDCNNQGAMCSKSYLARAGTVTVSAASKSPDAGTYAFTLSDVTYEAWDFTTDTAADGGCLTLSSFAFSGSWP